MIHIIITVVISSLTSVLTCLILNLIQNHRRKDKREKELKEDTTIASTPQHNEKKSSVPNVQQKSEVSTVDVGTSNASNKNAACQDKKLSKKEQQKLLRKEERAQKRQEEFKRKIEEEELRRKKNFDPLKSKPEAVTYKALAVLDGKLTPCEIGQTQYYRCWEYEGRIFFEFYCDKSKAAKAVNNRSAILEPFCVKNPNSVPVDSAKSMIIEQFGEIDSNYNIISKLHIKFE